MLLGGIWAALFLIIYVMVTGFWCHQLANSYLQTPFGGNAQYSACGPLVAVMLFCWLLISSPGIVLFIIGAVKWNSEEEYKNIVARSNVHVNVHASEKDLRRIDAHLKTKRTQLSDPKDNPTTKEQAPSSGPTIHCTNCGTKANKRAKFCRNCGHKIKA